MLFQNTSAPTGWTKETNAAYNNVSLRLVTGSVSSGGTENFSDIFGASVSTDAHTLTTAQMPAHTHTQNSGSLNASTGGITAFAANNTLGAVTGSTGGGGSHSHGLQLDLKYRDFILAQKD
jgi:microcystin-dependent protein